MTQPFRLAAGGRIDRARLLTFNFDGRKYHGYAGDTLASALLANGVRVTGRSFKYHRPRGLMAAGSDEANTLVQLGEGARTEPNLKATQIELHDGLRARAVNCAPSARFDWMAATQWLKPFMPAGFYYKTFMAPHWDWYEWAIRRAAGLGQSPVESDPDVYDKRHADCDVLVIGGGPAGLRAALDAAASGASVTLADDQSEPGGSLLWQRDAAESLKQTLADLAARAKVTLLSRTTVFGYYDHNHLLAVEHLPGAGGARQRLWKIRAGAVILATGAIERPLVFRNNDRPGVMLASAARHYLNRYAVAPGRRVLIATNNDSAYDTALDLHAAGIEIAGIVDLRAAPGSTSMERAASVGLAQKVFAGMAPTDVAGAHGLRRVELHAVDAQGRAQRGTRRVIEADSLLVSGGWNPAVHLYSQSGGTLRYDEAQHGFVPQQSVQRESSVGAAAGIIGAAPQAAIREIDGSEVGQSGDKSWVDLLSDVTAADIRLAVRENYRSVEHVKRYTTTGMAPDQGKTSNVNAIAVMGAALNLAPGAVGTTRFRPPYNPVTFGAIAGRHRGAHYKPLRRLPAHESHVALGAQMEDYGGWLRAACYPRAGESEAQAIAREVALVRSGVGMFDGSPLGKILVHGPDAGELLHRIYLNNIRSLKTRHCRYAVMLGEDGVVMDDGICTRLAEHTYLVGTTSGHAARVTDWLEEWLQCEWVELDVVIEPVTTQWAVATLTGPNAREALAQLGSTMDLSAEAFPHMTVREGKLGKVPLRILRVSFTGELSYEISVPSGYGRALWDALLEAGRAQGIAPFGVESLMVLRVERGYLHVGSDTGGDTFPQDIGLAELMQKKPEDFAGRRSTMTPEGLRQDRRQLVGLRALDDRTLLPVGAHVVGADFRQPPYLTQGWVTSSVRSPTLGRPLALALVANGRARLNEEVRVYDAGRLIAARIVETAAYDPAGARLHG